MNKEEVKMLLQKFGLSDNAAEYYSNFEVNDKENRAWLAAFRFVRPVNNSLEFYKAEYSNVLKHRIEQGLDISEAETELINKGVPPELLGKFAYEIALTAINEVLYRLSDPAGSDYDLENEGEGLPSWTLMERDPNYGVTGRHVSETHSLIPFSNL